MAFILRLRQPHHCLRAVLHPYRDQPALPQISRHLSGTFFAFLRNQHRCSLRQLQSALFLRRDSDRNLNRKAASLLLFALHLNLAFHPFHQIFDNRHTKTSTLYLTGLLIMHPFKGDKDPLQKLFAHPHTIILTAKIQPYFLCAFLPRHLRHSKMLCKSYLYAAAILCILHCISDDIHQNLP